MKIFVRAGQRLLLALPCLTLVLVLLFVLLTLAPGDAVDALMGQIGGADDSLSRLLRTYYGLDVSMPARVMAYVARLTRGDFGVSLSYGTPVAALIFQRLPVTLVLMTTSLVLAFGGGALAGLIAARNVGRWPDAVLSVVGMVIYATPSFWFALLAIGLFAVTLGWLPAGGLYDLRAGKTGFSHVLDMAVHLLMPVITLSAVFAAVYMRMMRTAMLEITGLDFLRTARAKGVSERRVMWAHALGNAMLPMITIAGLQAGSMLGGAVVVENVFSLPGLGGLAYEAVTQRDLNMLLGIVVMSAVLVVAVNFVVDILYAWLDPRIDFAA